ncbi:MAG: glycosyltransferase family 4 protein [Chitinophagaceae bacterium]
MHVLHIFNEINFSGAEIMYANAAPLFQKEGIRMTAVSTGKNKGNFVRQFEKANIHIIHRPLPPGFKSPFFLFRYFKSIYAFIKKEKVDIVHIHRPDIFWFYAVCTFFAGRKSIMTAHNNFKNRKFTWIKAYLERMSARKIFRTTFQTIGESVYNNELNYYKNPSVRVNNWYDSERFFPASENEKDRVRQELGVSQEDFIIVSAGSCSAVKNHSAIIHALKLVLPACRCVYFHLGTGHLEDEEKKEAAALNVQEHTRFLGNKVNVRDYLIASDVFIMPSRFEGLSIAAIEAMACKLPSILYNSPGLTDLIKNDDNGFLINQDIAAIAEKILFFKNNPASMREKGNNAYKFVTTHFYMPDNVAKIIELYKK